MIYAVAAIAVCVTMAMALVRAFAGPTVYDRILAANSFGGLTVVLIAVAGFLMGRPEFLDLALIYALINFIGAIAVTKFCKFRDMGHGLERPEDQGGDI